MKAEESSVAARRPFDWLALVLGVSFALIWSSAFTSAKIALADAPPIWLLTIRFLVAGGIALGIALAFGQRLPNSAALWRAIIIFGICQNSLYLGLNFFAMTMVPAGLAAIIASALPLTVALANATLFKARLSLFAMGGLFLGFMGVIAIMAGRIDGGASLIGIVCCVLGVIALTAATLTVRHIDFSGQLMMVIGLQMLVGSLGLLPIALAFESLDSVRYTNSLIIAFTYTTIVPGLVATYIWFLLVKRVGATPAATFHFLNPAFGVAIAGILLGEALNAIDGLGVLLVTISILIVQLAGRSSR